MEDANKKLSSKKILLYVLSAALLALAAAALASSLALAERGQIIGSAAGMFVFCLSITLGLVTFVVAEEQ